MQNVWRTAGGLLVLFVSICVGSGVAGSATTSGSQPRLTRSVKLMPGVALTPVQYERYRAQLDRVKGASSRANALAVNAASAAGSAPLLPPRQIDPASGGFQAFKVGDVTGDSRPDVVTFGVRPAPNTSLGQVLVYPQTASGLPGEPIRSPVDSQMAFTRPEGMAITPVLGTRPDIVVWGSFWIEIYSVATNGAVAAVPLTIAPNLVVRHVVISDLNADGRPDLIVSGEDYNVVNSPTVVRRYLQTAGGGFTAAGTDAVFTGGYGVLADVDGDGIIDELDGVGTSTTLGFTYHAGLANGTFGPEVSVLESSSAFASVSRLSVADLDDNGLPDVILATGEGGRVRFQTSPGTFSTVLLPTPASAGNISQVTIGDLDGNGLRDAILWTDGYNLMQVALQTAPRVFTTAGSYDVLSGGFPSFYDDTTAIVDVNGDGKADVLTITAGVVAYYNSAGTYPVLDASVTSTAQAEDTGAIAHLEWQHRVSNAGPTVLADGFLLQDLPVQYEFAGANVPCTIFVTMVVCPVASLPAGNSTTITIRADSVMMRASDGNIPTVVTVLNDGPEIDTNSGNDSAAVSTLVRAHPEELQAAGNEIFVYESAGGVIIPVIGAPGTSSISRCGGWYLQGPNPVDGGVVGDINGTLCMTPAQGGLSRGFVGLRDGSTANGALHYNLALAIAGVTLPGPHTFTIVDDEGGDPRLTSAGAQPFEAWPALFSSAQTLYSRVGHELPTTAVIGDLDGDGRKDLAVSFGADSGNWIGVWLQRPDGTLSETPLKWNGAGSSLAIADVTGDNTAELIVSGFTEVDLVRLVNGQLQTVDAVPMDSRNVAVADLDLDGFNDIVVTSNIEQSVYGPQYWVPNVTVFHGNAQRTLDATPYRFAAPYNGLRSQLVLGKFDDDSLPDIAITSNGSAGVFPGASIAYQKQDGTFAAPVAVWIAGPGSVDGVAFGDNVTSGDFNGDGRTDLAISSFLGDYVPSVWIFTDLRHDDFSRPSQRLYAGNSTSLAAIDVNNDGRDDLLADYSISPAGPRTPVQVFIQSAGGKLIDAGKLPKFGSGLADRWIQKLATGDLDGDGHKDAVILDSMDGYVHVMHSAAAGQAVQLAALESSDSIAPGARARYRLRVTNSGTRRSLEIPLSWTMPPQFSAPQIVGAKGACYLAASTAQCLLPQLDPGGHVDVMLTGSFTTAGNYAMSISAGPAGAYGSRSQSVTVTAANSGGGSSSSGGGSSGGGSSGGGGGSLEWLTLFWVFACFWVRAARSPTLVNERFDVRRVQLRQRRQ